MSEKIKARLSKIKNIVLVLSGKGGVGKSTCATQVALDLAMRGHKVGLLDVDICGPSVPTILGLTTEQVYKSSQGFLPVQASEKLPNLVCMSIGFIIKQKDFAVIWRGPRKHMMIKQFLEDVCWGDLDYLVVDTPPGTSDEHITIAELIVRSVQPSSPEENKTPRKCTALLVTTPQQVSIDDVSREVGFCYKLNIQIRGIIENMSGFRCPCCSDVTYIFSKDGGRQLAERENIRYIGSIPIDPDLAKAEDEGVHFIQAFSDSPTAKIISNLVSMAFPKANPEKEIKMKD